MDYLDLNSYNYNIHESVDTSKITDANDDYFQVSSWSIFCSFDIPFDLFYQLKININDADEKGVRVYGYCLDSDKQVLVGETYKGCIGANGFTYNAETGAITTGINIKKSVITVMNKLEDVKYIRVSIQASSSIKVTSVKVIAFANTGKDIELLSSKPRLKFNKIGSN